MPDKRTKKMQKDLPLEGIIAFVDTQNDDGTDTSETDGSLIRSLGAVIADSFSDEITHFVCSTASTKRLKAAAIFEIVVVSRAWIQSCVLSGLRTSEEDFALDNEKSTIAATDSIKLATSSKSIAPQKSALADEHNEFGKKLTGTNPQEIRASRPKSNKRKDIVQTTEMHPQQNAATSRESDANLGTVKRVRDSNHCQKGNSGALLDSLSAQTTIGSESPIPLPKFKEVAADKVLPAAMKLQRRSERICDNADSQEECPPDVDVNVSMPIVRLDSQEASCNKIVTGAEVAEIRLFSDKKKNAPETSTGNVKGITGQITEVVKFPLKGDKKSELVAQKNAVEKGISKVKVESSCDGGSRMVDILGAKIVIAISGFDEIGEKATMTSSLQHFIDAMNTNCRAKDKRKKVSRSSSSTSSSDSSSSSSSSSKKTSGPVAVLLDQEEDSFGLHCTHVILQSSSSKRSLRILLALARGIPIVTEEWFYTSLSCQEWMDPMPYLHARHSSQQTARGLHKPQRIFLNTKFFVGYSTNPSQIFLETILSASGGSIADNITSSDYLIFGSCQDSQDWLEKNTSDKSEDTGTMKTASDTEISQQDIQTAYKMVLKKRVVSCKYICDCLEAGKVITPLPSANHLIEFTNSSDAAKKLSGIDEGSKKRKSSVDVKDGRLSWDSMETEKGEEKYKNKTAKSTVDKKKKNEVKEPIIRKNIVTSASSKIETKVSAVMKEYSSTSKSEVLKEKKTAHADVNSATAVRNSSKRSSNRTVVAVHDTGGESEEEKEKEEKDEEKEEKEDLKEKGEGTAMALTSQKGVSKGLQSGFKFSVPGSSPSDRSRRRLSNSKIIVDSPEMTPSPISSKTTSNKVSKNVTAIAGAPSWKKECSLPKAKKDSLKNSKSAKQSEELAISNNGVDENNNLSLLMKSVLNAAVPVPSTAVPQRPGQHVGIDKACTNPQGRPDSPCW